MQTLPQLLPDDSQTLCLYKGSVGTDCVTTALHYWVNTALQEVVLCIAVRMVIKNAGRTDDRLVDQRLIQ